MKTSTALTLAAFVLASPLLASQARAELPDPTRPPATLGLRAGADAAGDGLPRLQSILISPRQGGRHVAVIDGETVRLGERYKGARVARMTQSQVELVRGQERQVLRLHPAAALAGAPAGPGAKLAN